MYVQSPMLLQLLVTSALSCNTVDSYHLPKDSLKTQTLQYWGCKEI